MRLIKSFISEYDVVMLQETKLNALEDKYLNFDGYKTFYSNKDDKHAGVATIIGPKMLKNYAPTLIKSSRGTCGNVLQIRMRSKNHHQRDFTIDNLYLKSGTDMKAKKAQLEALVHGADDTVFMGGDFNFTEREEDGGARIGGKASEFWSDLCQKLGLAEVYQGSHTFSRPGYSSRIDRIYCNLNEADRSLYYPTAYVKASDAADIKQVGETSRPVSFLTIIQCP